MMGMSASDGAVWLQTTCLWNAADQEDSSDHEKDTNNRSSILRDWNGILSAAFFRCNIVVASMDAPRVLDLSDSQLLPCGDDNLLFLQNLRSDNTGSGVSTFQMLLSECYMIPLSSVDATLSGLYSRTDDGKHGHSVEGWQVDVSPSTFHWTDQQVFHQQTVTFNLTNAFETFRSSRNAQERNQAAETNRTQRQTSQFAVEEPYQFETSSPTIEGMCQKDDIQNSAVKSNREVWEELLKQSIENELHQIDFILIFLAVIAFVLSMFFIWEMIGFSHKYRKNIKRSSCFSVSPVPSSIAPVSSTPAFNKSGCKEITSTDGVAAAPTTLDISPLSLDPVFASTNQYDRVRKHQLNPEEAPEETPCRIQKMLRPTTNSKRHLAPSIVSPEREQYLPISFTSSTTTTTRPPTLLTHVGQRQQQQSQSATPVPRIVLAKCYRPSEGRFILRPIPITPPAPSPPRNEPSSNISTTCPSNVDVLQGDNDNHAVCSTWAVRREPGFETPAGASFVHDYWCD